MPVLTRAAGYPSLASNSASKFTPEIWSALMIEQFYPATVVGALANTAYEGEISGYGDTVVIRTSPAMTITDYEVGMDLTYETPESVSTVLEINKGKSFAFAIESVDKFQSDLDLITDWSEQASMAMAVQIDTEILGDIYNDADAANQGAAAGKISGDINLGAAGTPLALTSANVLEWIINLGTVFDEQNVPQTERSIVLPAKVLGLIKNSELKDASISGDSVSVARNGRVGMIDRFQIYHSNLLDHDAVSGEYNIIASHKSALTFASQMDEGKMVHMLNPNRHGELIRGLQVYGYSVIKPESLAWSVVTA